MKKIIDGKMYDTETSEIIYINEYTNRRMYRTRKGNYFFMYPNGEIVPKTEDEVKIFLGENDTDKYIELFGNVEEA